MASTSELRKAFLYFAAATALLYVLLVSVSVLGFFANRNRIEEIQNARRVSCERTYEGVREVFIPFFRPIKERTKAEQKDIDLFNKTVDGLKKRCDKQTRT